MVAVSQRVGRRCIYLCIYMYIYIYICIYVCMYVCVYVCIYRHVVMYIGWSVSAEALYWWLRFRKGLDAGVYIYVCV